MAATARTWVSVPETSTFGVQTLPYGVFSVGDEDPRVGVAVGDQVVDLAPLAAVEGVEGGHVFGEPSLNPFLALGRPAWSAVRGWLTELLTSEAYRELVEPHLLPVADVTLRLPFEVADYVDFYASRAHAENVGRLFRPDGEALPASWLHLPIGYHGRSGTVVVSGTDVVRPHGLRRPPGAERPEAGPSQRLDVEAEVGFVVGTPSALGVPVPQSAFRDHVFGVVLVNDWSARDIQAFEYVPLGPFLGKSFATSVSAWVVPLDALEPATVALPPREVPVAPYLEPPAGADAAAGMAGLDLALEVRCNGTTVSRPPFAQMYWSAAQMLAHLTANGASVRTGDLFASGTVSGTGSATQGCLLELTDNGRAPVTLDDGSRRGFLDDGDEVVITGTAPGAGGGRVGLGEVRGRVVATA